MTTTYKVLGQSNPAASTATVLYTVPTDTSTIVSTLSICNQGASTIVRAAVRPNGEPLSAKHYLLYDVPIAANDTLFFTIGITLAMNDVITVYANTSNISFNLYGSEITP